MVTLPLPFSARRLLALVVGAALAGAGFSCSKTEAPASPAAKVAAGSPATPAAPADVSAPAEVQKMFGRWLRSDGTYVLEIKGADRSGVVQAAYFNPKPINVSRAIWMRSAEGLQVMVELNDVGYPGATYVLSHDVKSDTLVGKYNQPQMGQTFEIDFVRQKQFP